MTAIRCALIAITAGAGCAWGPGGSFGEFTAQLDARYQLAPGRDTGDGWQRLASDYQVRVTIAAWTTSSLALLPGAEGAGPAAPVLELPTGALDLIAAQPLALACGGEPCELGLGSIERAELEVTGVSLAGTVRDGQKPERRPQATFTMSAALAQPVRLTGALELPVDRASPPRIQLSVGAHPGAELFDGVDWTALPAGAIDLAAAPAARAAITTALGQVELALDVDRSD